MRLTNAQREIIEKAVLKATVDVEKEKFLSKVSENVFWLIRDKNSQYEDFLATAINTPFIMCANIITVRIDNEGWNKLTARLNNPVPIWADWRDYRGAAEISVADDKKWHDIFVELAKEKKEMYKRHDEFERELRAVLSSVTTNNQLLKVFPEVTKFVDMSTFNTFPVAVKADKLLQMIQEYSKSVGA